MLDPKFEKKTKCSTTIEIYNAMFDPVEFLIVIFSAELQKTPIPGTPGDQIFYAKKLIVARFLRFLTILVFEILAFLRFLEVPEG